VDKEEFVFGLNDLTEWFKVKLNENQVANIYDAVKYMPKVGWNEVVKDAIESRKPSPGYFPTIKELHAAYCAFADANPQRIPPKKYDRIEDQSFPVSLMEDGLELLRDTKDVDRFLEYAAKVNMPKNDVVRVISKYKNCYKVKIDFNESGKAGFSTEQPPF